MATLWAGNKELRPIHDEEMIRIYEIAKAYIEAPQPYMPLLILRLIAEVERWRDLCVAALRVTKIWHDIGQTTDRAWDLYWRGAPEMKVFHTKFSDDPTTQDRPAGQ